MSLMSVSVLSLPYRGRGGSLVERRTPVREVQGSKTKALVNTKEVVAPFQND